MHCAKNTVKFIVFAKTLVMSRRKVFFLRFFPHIVLLCLALSDSRDNGRGKEWEWDRKPPHKLRLKVKSLIMQQHHILEQGYDSN